MNQHLAVVPSSQRGKKPPVRCKGGRAGLLPKSKWPPCGTGTTVLTYPGSAGDGSMYSQANVRAGSMGFKQNGVRKMSENRIFCCSPLRVI